MITNLKMGYNGRFGNQIFQLASLIGISSKLGYEFLIPNSNLNPIRQTTMDGKSFDARFELQDCFDIDSKYFGEVNINSIVSERHFHFDENMFKINDNTSIDGYFQTEKYFKHCKNLILEVLKFKDDIYSEAKSLLPNVNKELVSIHIRRGDYTTPNPYHPVLGEDYINNALEYFNDDDYHFVVFSDDLDWCESVWGSRENFTMFRSSSHFVDLCGMSLCDHNIITNSSFSWWGSYLSKRESKKVIAPDKWFGPGYAHYITADIYRDDMILVETEKKNTNTIDILTICTGKYTVFFKDFYESCEKFFLPGYNKRYFVFTDGELLESENIVKIHQNKLGWPYDTMMRFKMFNSIKNELNGDYVFFFNVNIKFISEVGEEVLPKEENEYLMGVIHPGFYNSSINHVPYERRYDSNFFIPVGVGSYYYQGCFNGGRTKEFLEMSSILESKINMDMANGIIPIWHDESALNWYYSTRSPLSLNSGYAYPESAEIPFDKKILQVDKNKFGGHHNLRN